MDKLLGKNYLWKLTHDETEHIMVVYLLRKSMVLSKRFSLSYMWRSPAKQTKGPQSLDRAMKRSQLCSDLGEQITRGASSRCSGSDARAPWRGRWGVQRLRRSGPIRTWRSVWVLSSWNWKQTEGVNQKSVMGWFELTSLFLAAAWRVDGRGQQREEGDQLDALRMVWTQGNCDSGGKAWWEEVRFGMYFGGRMYGVFYRIGLEEMAFSMRKFRMQLIVSWAEDEESSVLDHRPCCSVLDASALPLICVTLASLCWIFTFLVCKVEICLPWRLVGELSEKMYVQVLRIIPVR